MAEPNQQKQIKSAYRRSITVPVFGEIPIDPSEIIADLKVRENPPLWAQVFKYGVFGVLGAVLFFAVYALVDIFYPEYIADDLPKNVLKLHLLHVFVLAFVVSNIMSYITNRMFVFTPSDKNKWLELGIFFLVTGVSFYAGNLAKDWSIDAGMHKHLAAFSFAVSTMVVNFIMRKYLVFGKRKVPEAEGL